MERFLSLLHPPRIRLYDLWFRLMFARNATIPIDMGRGANSREVAASGNLFPPSSNDSPVAFGDGNSVKRYVTLVSPHKTNGTSTYEPLSSVWEGSDKASLEAVFGFYATLRPDRRAET